MHRKASAKTQESLTRFLQSEVKIIHIIVRDQDGQNDNILLSSILAIWPAHLSLLDLFTLLLGQRYKLWSTSLRSLLHSPFASVLDPNIRLRILFSNTLRILFSNTLSLHFSLNVRDYVSQPYSTIGNIVVLYILIFKFLVKRKLDCISLYYICVQVF